MSSRRSVVEGPEEVDRVSQGHVLADVVVVMERRPFLPGVSSEEYFGNGKPVLGVRIRKEADGRNSAYMARRLSEVAESRTLAVVVMTDGPISIWERAGIRAEYVPYGLLSQESLESDIIELWGIDIVLDYEDAVNIG